MTKTDSLHFKEDAKKRESKLLQTGTRLQNKLTDLREMMVKKCLVLPSKRPQNKVMNNLKKQLTTQLAFKT